MNSIKTFNWCKNCNYPKEHNLNHKYLITCVTCGNSDWIPNVELNEFQKMMCDLNLFNKHLDLFLKDFVEFWVGHKNQIKFLSDCRTIIETGLIGKYKIIDEPERSDFLVNFSIFKEAPMQLSHYFSDIENELNNYFNNQKQSLNTSFCYLFESTVIDIIIGTSVLQYRSPQGEIGLNMINKEDRPFYYETTMIKLSKLFYWKVRQIHNI
tara:strand:- start:36 stop:665 length:630 start_codon:yes stop_codon:yes gene_type:complete